MATTYPAPRAKSARIRRVAIDFDADRLDKIRRERERNVQDEDHKRNVEWANSDNAGCVQRAGGVATGTETILRPRQEDLDIARLQHSGVPDEQE